MLHKIGVMSALILGLAMPAAAECLIQKDGIGGIKLGQNLKQVKQKFPKAKMDKTSDADGVSFIAITLSKDILVFASQDGEDDPDAPIKLHKKINFLETDSPTCHTASGVHPGLKTQKPNWAKSKESNYQKSKRVNTQHLPANQNISDLE